MNTTPTPSDTPSPAGSSLHAKLWEICKVLPEDYEPYGKGERDGGDCSCGCLYYLPLEGKLGADWGVCRNPDSHRCGLLTFEHQGCGKFAYDEALGEE